MVERQHDAGESRRPDEGGSAARPPLVEQLLGYLNFSSGASDGQFLANLNALFGQIAEEGSSGSRPVWKRMADRLRETLAKLGQSSATFRDAQQASEVLRLVFDEALPAYQRHHADLLFHQTDETLFRPLFIGRVCEAVLTCRRQEIVRISSFVVRGRTT